MTVKNTGNSRMIPPGTLAALLPALLFFVLFAFSGVEASTTLKETTVSTALPLPQLFFSLSSASILLIPVSLVCMICAVTALFGKQRNVAMMFSLASFVTFGLFMLFFSMEKNNSALYTPLSEALKEAGLKFKKREVKEIAVTLRPMVFRTLAAGGAVSALCFP